VLLLLLLRNEDDDDDDNDDNVAVLHLLLLLVVFLSSVTDENGWLLLFMLHRVNVRIVLVLSSLLIIVYWFRCAAACPFPLSTVSILRRRGADSTYQKVDDGCEWVAAAFQKCERMDLTGAFKRIVKQI
jgi:hypothetical protein